MKEIPRWERGWRVHGYWLGMLRVGWVGKPPGRNCAKEGYSWHLSCPDRKEIEGKAATLKQAKKMVERHYRRRQSLADR